MVSVYIHAAFSLLISYLAFGFLASEEIQKAGATNLGLRDRE